MAMPWTTSKYRYRPSRLASLPRELDPEEFNITPEKRRADEERLAIRARLKRQYQLQLNDPRRTHIIEDPAMLRWAYARAYNVYTSGRPTPKTSLLGALVGLGPLFFWYYVFKTERNRKEKLIQEGKYVRPFKSLF